jgi:uncharacterized protein
MGNAPVVLVVLDSNLFFSALISPHGNPALCYKAWREKRFDLVTCLEQIEEIRQASRYGRIQSVVEPHEVGEMVNNIRRSQVIHPLPRKNQAADPTDAFLLDLAEASGADYLVTGDKHSGLPQRKRIGRANIITSAAFCNQVLQLS